MFMLMLRRPGATRRLCDAEEMIVVLLLEWLVCVMEFHSTSTKWPHRRFTASLVGIHLHQMAMRSMLFIGMAVAFGFSSTGGWSKISAKVLWTFSCNSSIVNSSRCCNSWSCAREFLCTIVGAVSTLWALASSLRFGLWLLILSCTGFGFLFILLGLLLLFGLLAFFCWDFLWRAAQSKPEATSRSPAAHSLWLAPAGAQHKI